MQPLLTKEEKAFVFKLTLAAFVLGTFFHFSLAIAEYLINGTEVIVE